VARNGMKQAMCSWIIKKLYSDFRASWKL